jgi:hypothetical protein
MQSGATHLELKVLHQHGWSVSALAREFGLSRTTVYLELASPGPRRYAERERPAAMNEHSACTWSVGWPCVRRSAAPTCDSSMVPAGRWTCAVSGSGGPLGQVSAELEP